jgi:hypothetical protein
MGPTDRIFLMEDLFSVTTTPSRLGKRASAQDRTRETRSARGSNRNRCPSRTGSPTTEADLMPEISTLGF